jgi:hypothetical protein
MNISKSIAAVLAAAVLLAANLRIVYTVSVTGEQLPSTFSAVQLEAGEAAARAAAEEIVQTGEDTAADYDRRPSLALSPPDGDPVTLARALIQNTTGVDTAWQVYVGGSNAGIVGDPTALGEVLEAILASGASDEAVSAEFADAITLRRVFVPEGREYDLMAVARAVRSMTAVMSVTADGTVRYG